MKESQYFFFHFCCLTSKDQNDAILGQTGLGCEAGTAMTGENKVKMCSVIMKHHQRAWLCAKVSTLCCNMDAAFQQIISL